MELRGETRSRIPARAPLPRCEFRRELLISEQDFSGTDLLANTLFVTAYFVGTRTSGVGPEVFEVANAEGESPTIAPNTWLEIKGVNLAPDTRIWQDSDFVGNQMPTAARQGQCDSERQERVCLLHQLDADQCPHAARRDERRVPVVVDSNGATSARFTAEASPSFFVLNRGPNVAATHLNGSLIGPTTLYPNASTPAKTG